MDKVTVLFVDDEKDFRFLSIRQITSNLKNLQFEFMEAADGEEALALLKEGLKPALIMVDYAMPGMNGAELLRIIDTDYPGLRDVPRIMISGYVRYENIQRESKSLRCTFFEKVLDANFYVQLCQHIEAELNQVGMTLR